MGLKLLHGYIFSCYDDITLCKVHSLLYKNNTVHKGPHLFQESMQQYDFSLFSLHSILYR